MTHAPTQADHASDPAAPGPAIDVWEGDHQVCGRSGMASPVFHIHGRVTPDADDSAPVHSISWSLNNRGRIPAAIGPTAFRVAAPGDFTIFLERSWLRAGENTLLILANDAAGRETTRRVTIELHPNARASLPMRVEWQGCDSVGRRVEVIDGRWEVQADAARAIEPGYDRALALGDVDWTDIDVRVPITLHAFDDRPASMQWPSMGCAVGVALRWRRHADWGDILPARGWFPLGALARLEHSPGDPAGTARLRLRAGGFVPPLAEGAIVDVEPGASFVLRARVRSGPGGPAHYDAKLWRAGDPEPDAWTVSAQGIPSELPRGAVLLTAHHADASFGTIEITAP